MDKKMSPNLVFFTKLLAPPMSSLKINLSFDD